MHKGLALKSNYPTQYNIFGVYVDWQIDNNLVSGLGVDPHGIASFSDFLEKSRWQVVTIEHAGRQMLSLNLYLPKFKLLQAIKIAVVEVNKNKLTSQDVIRILERYANKLGLPIFDVFKYYMANLPWNLKSLENLRCHSAMNQNENILVIDDVNDFFNKRIIVKVMTKDGHERITSANDILNGKTDENECLIDPTHYDDETSYAMEKYWSDQLGIPVLADDEEIDFSYKYNLSKQEIEEARRMNESLRGGTCMQ